MGGEIFCFFLAPMAVQQVFPAIGSKTDARMAQCGRTFIYLQRSDANRDAPVDVKPSKWIAVKVARA